MNIELMLGTVSLSGIVTTNAQTFDDHSGGSTLGENYHIYYVTRKELESDSRSEVEVAREFLSVRACG